MQTREFQIASGIPLNCQRVAGLKEIPVSYTRVLRRCNVGPSAQNHDLYQSKQAAKTGDLEVNAEIRCK
jgi:hypothetical protein